MPVQTVHIGVNSAPGTVIDPEGCVLFDRLSFTAYASRLCHPDLSSRSAREDVNDAPAMASVLC